MGVASKVLLVLVTIFCPPIGVFFIARCGMDLFINICLTLLGYIPGRVHAFYLEYVYYDRREQARSGLIDRTPAPGIHSDNVQRGGAGGYGSIGNPPTAVDR